MWNIRGKVAALCLMSVTCICGMAHAAYSCTVSVSGMAFGIYSPVNVSDTDTISDVTVACDGDSNVNVQAEVELSTGASGIFDPRTMLNGGNPLSYNIYRNSNRSRIWGDGSGGTRTKRIRCRLKGPPTSCSGSSTLYGRIPAGQTVPSGSYADTIIVTITY